MSTVDIAGVTITVNAAFLGAYDMKGGTRQAAATCGLIVKAEGVGYVDSVPARVKLLQGTGWRQLLVAAGRIVEAVAPVAKSKPLKVGDRVRWVSQGAEQWPDPKSIKRIEEGHAFFKGSGTGVPLSELARDDQASSS